MIDKIAEQLKEKRNREKYEGYNNFSNEQKQKNRKEGNRNNRDNRYNNRDNRYNNRDNRYNNKDNRYNNRNNRSSNEDNRYNNRYNNKDNRYNNRYNGENNRRNNQRPDDKNGWLATGVPELLGGAALIGGAGLAMKGDLGSAGKYVSQSKDRAFKGMQKYMKKNSKGKTRIVSNILEKAVKDYKKRPKTGRRSASEDAKKQFNEILNRRREPDLNFIKEKSAQQYSQAKIQNDFERGLAKKENRKPNLLPEDPSYYMNKNKREFISDGYSDSNNKNKPNANQNNKKENLKGLIGSSVIGGASFAGGIAAVHSIERALEKKEDEKNNRKRREEVFKSAYQIPF